MFLWKVSFRPPVLPSGQVSVRAVSARGSVTAVELLEKSWVWFAVLSPEGVRDDFSLSREVFTENYNWVSEILHCLYAWETCAISGRHWMTNGQNLVCIQRIKTHILNVIKSYGYFIPTGDIWIYFYKKWQLLLTAMQLFTEKWWVTAMCCWDVI